MKILFAEEITEKHPEVVLGEVAEAIRNCKWYRRRSAVKIAGVGFSNNGRLYEFLFVEYENYLYCFHAFTPPTQKFLKELNLIKGGKNVYRS